MSSVEDRQLTSQLNQELQQIGGASGRPMSDITAELQRDLHELGGRRGRLGSWLFASLSRFIRRRGYPQQAVYDLGEWQQVREAMSSGSTVFLISHKTYLDFFVLFEFFYDQGIPPPRIFGGANMAFAGFGLLARHAGGIFIRRSFREDPVYKAALRHRLRTLIQEGESFMWAIEGTRSRTGKLLIPRLGLLHYMTDSSQQLDQTEVRFVPVALVYDRIPDVADMAAQDAGAVKPAESLSWFMRYLRSLGGSLGDIHLRFGQPIMLHETPAAPDLMEATATQSHQAEVQKLAFEACFRINQISPATPTSLVLLSLLCHGRRNKLQIRQDVLELAAAVRAACPGAQEQMPSRSVEGDTDGHVNALLAAGVLEAPEGWPQNELRIRPKAISMAIYYSNMAAHHFVISAFAELALALLVLRGNDASQEDFLGECFDLRELFKYEFFFSRKDEFQRHLLQELQALGTSLRSGQPVATLLQSLRGKKVRVAVGVLSPYLAAYRQVVTYLLTQPVSSDESDEALLGAMLSAAHAAPAAPARHNGLPETGVSRALLANGLLVAGNYRLRAAATDEPGQDEAIQRQRKFSARLDAIEAALGLLAALNRDEHDAGPAVQAASN
jgi:glycerol-3-phosphate O-acyltransferase